MDRSVVGTWRGCLPRALVLTFGKLMEVNFL